MTEMRIRSLLRRVWRPLLAVVWVAFVASITLRPRHRWWQGLDRLADLCLICGTRGSADAVLNLLLFVPVGFLAASRGRGPAAGFLVGLAVSGLIEGWQLFLAGRHAGLADLVWNSSGAFVGALLWRAVEARVTERDDRAALGAAGFVAVALTLGGALLIPWQTEADYWGQWMPDLGFMTQYEGEVLEASLNDQPFPSYRLPAEPPHRRLLEVPWELAGTIVAGGPPRSVSPILSIYDRNRQEIMLVGAHHTDLIYRERNLARALRFDSPDVRILGGFLDVRAGDTVAVSATRGEELCLRIDGTERCGVGVTPGRSWGLLYYLEGPSESFRRIVDFLWLVSLFMPIGFFSLGMRGWSMGAGIGLGGLGAAVLITPMVAPGLAEIVACICGMSLGALTARVFEWVADEATGVTESV